MAGPPSSLIARALILIMLLLCGLPDAMVVPVLKQLLVDRYGVSVGMAHGFMCVNILGAMLAAPVLLKLRHCAWWKLVAAAGAVNGILLLAMAYPIGFSATLAIRSVEGASDVVVYAILFERMARMGPSLSRGRRLGAAATMMMLGIAGGLALGGWIGNVNPVATLPAGATACGMVTALCLAGARLFRRSEAQPTTAVSRPTMRTATNLGPLWPALCMNFSDRAVASLLAITVPFFLASVAELSPAATGAMVGLSMLMTALLTWPAGRFVERLGVVFLRRTAGVCFAGGIVAVPFSIQAGPGLTTVVMIVVGIAGAALFASSLVAAAAAERGAAGMGAYHAAGNAGFLLGTVSAGGMLFWLGGAVAAAHDYQTVFATFAVVHVSITLVTCAALQGTKTANRTAVTNARSGLSSP